MFVHKEKLQMNKPTHTNIHSFILTYEIRIQDSAGLWYFNDANLFYSDL